MPNDDTITSELTDEQAGEVVGGVATCMECSSCHHAVTWQGNFCGQLLQCPVCGQNTFRGIRTIGSGFISV